MWSLLKTNLLEVIETNDKKVCTQYPPLHLSVPVICFHFYEKKMVCFFTDHMEGLKEIIPLLNRKNSVKVNHRIYCSDISREFLINRYGRETKRYIERMAIDKETKVRVFDKRKKEFYYPSVTAISANHCPGSIMFLFEHDDLRTLYTGDFRFENIRLESIESLHHIGNVQLYFVL